MRGRYKLVLCPGDPDQLFDLGTDPQELRNVAATIPSMRSASSTCGPRSRRGMTSRASSRRSCAASPGAGWSPRLLERGLRRPWDLGQTTEQRYVRGDFWGAVKYGQ